MTFFQPAVSTRRSVLWLVIASMALTSIGSFQLPTASRARGRMHLTLPSYTSFHSTELAATSSSSLTSVSSGAGANQNGDTTTRLWYRDRSHTEEQWTSVVLPSSKSPSTPAVSSSMAIPSSSTSSPAPQSPTEEPWTAVFRDIWSTGAIDVDMVMATCRTHLVAFFYAFGFLSLVILLQTLLHHFFATAGMLGGVGSSTTLPWSEWTGPGTGFRQWTTVASSSTMTATHPLWDWTLTPWRCIQGIVAALPLIALGTLVEHSEHRSASHVHFSITNTVLALFGRRRQKQQQHVQRKMEWAARTSATNHFIAAQTTSSPITNTVTTTTSSLQVLLFSTLLAVMSAFSEELIFRGLLPTVLLSLTHSVPLALVGQSLLYGIGQIRKSSSLTENGVFSGLQAIHGLWYGLVYLALGGDIMPVIIAHVLYECHIVNSAWKAVNDQMDYTEVASCQPMPVKQQQEVDRVRQRFGAGVDSMPPDTVSFCRKFFYAFDSEHVGTLSLADVKRAVAYAFLQDDMLPSDARAKQLFHEMMELRHSQEHHAKMDAIPPTHPPSNDGADGETAEERLDLPEFLQLLMALKSKKWNGNRNQSAA